VGVPPDDAAGHLRHHDRPHHLCRVRDAAGRHPGRARNILPEPHTQRNHLAGGINASGT
jgi:hypothetical protein